jgi:transcriptional antiterminator
MPLAELAERVGLSYRTLYYRIVNRGLSVKQAVARPLHDRTEQQRKPKKHSSRFNYVELWVEALEARGLPVDEHDKDNSIERNIVMLYRTCQSSYKVADMLGVSNYTILKHLRRLGEPIRKPGGANNTRTKNENRRRR